MTVDRRGIKWSPAMKIPHLFALFVALVLVPYAADAAPAAGKAAAKTPPVSDRDPGHGAGSYYTPNVRDAAGDPVPIMQIPGSVVVVPQQVIRDQQAISVCDALRNVSGVSCR